MRGRESGISGDLKVGYAWASAPHSGSKTVPEASHRVTALGRSPPPLSTAPLTAWGRLPLTWENLAETSSEMEKLPQSLCEDLGVDAHKNTPPSPAGL